MGLLAYVMRLSVHKAIRTIEARLGKSIAILADLQGPKLRIGVVAGWTLSVVYWESG